MALDFVDFCIIVLLPTLSNCGLMSSPSKRSSLKNLNVLPKMITCGELHQGLYRKVRNGHICVDNRIMLIAIHTVVAKTATTVKRP